VFVGHFSSVFLSLSLQVGVVALKDEVVEEVELKGNDDGTFHVHFSLCVFCLSEVISFLE
jgi:hypothetical protein